MKMLALTAALRTYGMLLNHAVGYRRVQHWPCVDDRRLIHAAWNSVDDEIGFEDELHKILAEVASVGDPKAMDVVARIQA